MKLNHKQYVCFLSKYWWFQFILLLIVITLNILAIVCGIRTTFQNFAELPADDRIFFWLYLLFSLWFFIVTVWSLYVILFQYDMIGKFTDICVNLFILFCLDFILFSFMFFIELPPTIVRYCTITVSLYTITLLRLLAVPTFIYIVNHDLSKEEWKSGKKSVEIPSHYQQLLLQAKEIRRNQIETKGLRSLAMMIQPKIAQEQETIHPEVRESSDFFGARRSADIDEAEVMASSIIEMEIPKMLPRLDTTTTITLKQQQQQQQQQLIMGETSQTTLPSWRTETEQYRIIKTKISVKRRFPLINNLGENGTDKYNPSLTKIFEYQTEKFDEDSTVKLNQNNQ